MPRTKVCKSSKRNREKEIVMNERLREFDAAVDQELDSIDLRFNRICEDFSNGFSMIKQRLNKKTLELTLHDYFTYGLTESTNSSRLYNGSVLSTGSGPGRRNKSKDDGYLTEDSTNTGPTNQLSAIPSAIGRTPGTLRSIKIHSRRSRSACGYLNNEIKIPSAVHNSRSKLRTPQPTPRGQVLSVDRKSISKIYTDSPPALYRWPKQGEKIFSMSGSPVVVQTIPDLVANVNIPIRNGMLSLRPKKLEQIDKSFVEKIESETLMQIKQLQSNLSSILRYAEHSSEF